MGTRGASSLQAVDDTDELFIKALRVKKLARPLLDLPTSPPHPPPHHIYPHLPHISPISPPYLPKR